MADWNNYRWLPLACPHRLFLASGPTEPASPWMCSCWNSWWQMQNSKENQTKFFWLERCVGNSLELSCSDWCKYWVERPCQPRGCKGIWTNPWGFGKDLMLEKTLKAGWGRVDRGSGGAWHHQLNGHEFEQTPGVSEGQGSPACCSPWGRKQSDTAEQLNHNNGDLEVGGSKREIKLMQVGKAGGSKPTWTNKVCESGTQNPLRDNVARAPPRNCSPHLGWGHFLKKDQSCQQRGLLRLQ